MTREFIYTETFEKQWQTLGFTASDALLLEKMLIDDPHLGDVIEGTGGLRKVRFAYEGRGKSGSARVCYVDVAVSEKIIFITCFGKNEKDNLSKEEKNSIKKLVTILKSHYI